MAEQTECCLDFPSGPQLEPIGGSYLRRYDSVTGFQVLDGEIRIIVGHRLKAVHGDVVGHGCGLPGDLINGDDRINTAGPVTPDGL